MARDDHRISEAKTKDILEVLENLGVTGLKGRKPQLAGPCPICGGNDRFWVDTRKNACGCRKCGGGGDPIGAVMFVKACGFIEALDWLCGPEQTITDAERAKLDKIAAENKARKDREAAQFRAKAVARAREIWVSGVAAEDGPVRAYLARRGITRELLPRLPSCLRFHPDLPFMVPGQGSEYVQAHRGPAMLAAIQGPDDKFSAVHRTWFDLAAAQGKVSILNPVTGDSESRKKSWGSKKGGAIRLVRGATSVLVMGEGIETTLTAAVAGVWPGAHFWAGVDLGNMAGQRILGKGQRFAGVPDLDDAEAFLPPSWVTHLVYVMDGDSDPRTTRAQLLAGLRRAMLLRPGLRAQIAPCPAGKDLNDVLLEGVAS